MNSLWAITTLFNPQRYQRRVTNYAEFRRRLRLPLLAVELAFDGHGQLTDGDAEIVVRLQDGDVMWQKERLLNVGLRHLPPECDKVLWIDADIFVDDPQWPERVRAGLDQNPLVQAFDSIEFLGPDGTDAHAPPGRRALMASLADGVSLDDCVRGLLTGVHAAMPKVGPAWAARRELLEEFGWYDASITGGGSGGYALAALNRADVVREFHYLNDRQWAHFRSWAEPFADRVAGRIGFVTGTLRHLWHGDPADRRIRQRHIDLQPHQFDPVADITHAPGGPWRWASDKPAMHQVVRDYFAGRREDTVPA